MEPPGASAPSTPSPAPAAMSGAPCLMQRNVPTRFRSTVARTPSRSASVIGPMVCEPPALANRMSRCRRGPAAAATAAPTCSSTVTSATTYRAVPTGSPADADDAATCSSSVTAAASLSSVRPQIVTCAPSRTSRVAVPSPIPLPPPVTRAVYPAMPVAVAVPSVTDRPPPGRCRDPSSCGSGGRPSGYRSGFRSSMLRTTGSGNPTVGVPPARATGQDVSGPGASPRRNGGDEW